MAQLVMFFNLNRFGQRAWHLLISGALVLLAILFVVRFPASSPPIPEPSLVAETPNLLPRLGEQPRILSRTRFQSSTFQSPQSDFYRTIIDNNLFRPLGWTRPVPPPAYRLTGTIIPKDSKTPPQALILATADQKTHIVTLGDKLAADPTVIEIHSKHVILDRNGQRITLKLDTSVWLHTSKGRFSQPR